MSIKTHVAKQAAAALALLGLAAGTRAEDKTFLWKLGAGPNPSFLLGSIHVAREEMYPLPDAMEAAFASCDNLVVEADPEALGALGMQKLIAEYAYYPDDHAPLQDQIGEVPMRALTELLARYNMSPIRFERMKPWYVSQVITLLELSRRGVDPQNGIDLHFLRKARDRKPILELEGVTFQLMFLNHFSHDEQRLMLEYSLRDLARMDEVFDELFDAWESGNPEQLNRLFTDFLQDSEGLEDVYEKLLAGRNVPMFRKIRTLLAGEETHFIVVGAGHLIGERGLLKMLEEDGVPLEQVHDTPGSGGTE